MSMNEQKLKTLLSELHTELKQQESLDDESLNLLKQVITDAEAIGNDASQTEALQDKIQQQALQFEQDHPTLAEILRQIMDTLGRIGV